MNPPYRALSPYLQEQFGVRVQRVTLDAGSDCPNRDGTKGRGGCIYCDVDGSGNAFLRSGIQLKEQLRRGIIWFRSQYPDRKAIAYFQSFSNTYVSPERLRETLSVLDQFGDEIAGLSVATRPDTFPEWAAALLATYKKRFPVWVELGLETAHDETLQRINRLHTFAEFEEAAARVRQYGMELVTHVILGLPGETPDHFRVTAERVAKIHPDGIKIHHLMVLKKTILEEWFRQGKVKVFHWKTYLQHLCDFLERIPPDIVIHRLLGDALPQSLVAPIWKISKNRFLQEVGNEMLRRKSFQGRLVSNPAGASHSRENEDAAVRFFSSGSWGPL